MKQSDFLKYLKRDSNGRLILDDLKEGIDYTLEEEQKGKRDKVWIKFADKRFLVKAVKPGTFEDYSELLVEELCTQVGMPTAHYDLAIFNGQPCVITEDYLDKSKNEQLVSGKTFMGSTLEILIDSGLYTRIKDKDQKELNNLDMIRRCLSVYLPKEVVDEEMKNFDMLFALNCFCQNGDLHLSNWSVIYDPSHNPMYRCAPNYDFGSYFRFNVTKSNVSEKYTYLAKQKRPDMMKRILDDEMFGKDFDRHDSLTYRYDTTEMIGLSRLEEAYKDNPDRFNEIMQKLYEINPDEAIMKVRQKLGNSPIPQECTDWFKLVIECNKKRIVQLVNEMYASKKEGNSYGL